MKECDLGIIGLGVMGRNLVLNFADHGFAVAGYDQQAEAVEALRREADGRELLPAADLAEFVRGLRRPRAILLLVPAGAPVDAVLEDMRPHLAAGDVIIDGGNSFFEDTERRQQQFAGPGIHLLGMGVSGGAYGARHGPSLMPGGPRAGYERVRPLLEVAAARVNDEPCVAYLGAGGAGHFVKMVHNGIEYGTMQLIAETYHLLKQGLGMDDAALHELYAEWNEGELGSYLMEITARIFAKEDPLTGQPLLDMILDVARQKGTGMWTSRSALELQVPAPTIDQGVMMRDLSAHEEERRLVSGALQGARLRAARADRTLPKQLRRAYLGALILTYAQGFTLLQAASQQHEYRFSLAEIARIWRGGCIIRSALLEDIRQAFSSRPDLPNLVLDDGFAGRLAGVHADLRRVVCAGARLGVPVPAFMASLSYFDALRSDWLPANLIQAQRDFFGSHTYERTDREGRFHTEWQKD